MRERLLWICVGAVGLVLAAGVGLAASQLTRTPIGLSAEPIQAGEALTPKATATPKPRRRPKPRATPTPTPTPARTATIVPPVATVDDHGGGDDSSGSGKGRSGDDD